MEIIFNKYVNYVNWKKDMWKKYYEEPYMLLNML